MRIPQRLRGNDRRTILKNLVVPIVVREAKDRGKQDGDQSVTENQPDDPIIREEAQARDTA